MKRSLVILCIGLVGIPAAGAFYCFGRSIWFPVYARIKGRQTTESVVNRIAQRGIGIDSELLASTKRLAILAFKEEQTLEVWAHADSVDTVLLKRYPFTGFSGKLGPKLAEGDRQIPEGIYKVEYLNPNSSYHLSIKIDYPNEFDREKGRADGRERLGSDIFIHGKDVTIGCIPIGDDAIEELFYLVATIGKTNTTVIISPYDMRKGLRDLEIEDVEWESELYRAIETALEPMRK